MVAYPTTVGLISDTHGLLRKTAVEALSGVDLILHAGDIDRPDILDDLEKIAPVYAVRGNMDFGPGVRDLAPYLRIAIDDVVIGVIHDRAAWQEDLQNKGLSVLVFGHSHQPVIEEKNGIVHVNPGSAGPRRFQLPISLGIMRIENKRVHPLIVELQA
ncbi:MAG: metallophosphoesterase family protein [Thermodesulfobacteriota bacterium]